jgi:putative SOS response-associated peptidase YedK
MADGPLAFGVITVPANTEVALHHDRHGAIIQRRQVMQWLDGTVSEGKLLVTPPARIFRVAEMNSAARQEAFAL